MKVLITTSSDNRYKEPETYESLEECVDELLELYNGKLKISKIPDYYPECLRDHKYIIEIDE